LDRRQALRTLAATVSLAAGCGGTVTSAHRHEAAELARESMSVDLHSHAGMLRSSTTSLDGQLGRMARGTLKASLFCAVGDGPVLGRRPQSGFYAVREPRAGELCNYTYSSLGLVTSRAAAGTLLIIERPADLDAARAQSKPGAILAVEGGDFLEGRIERVREAYDRGIRCIQLTHYRINELGDIQTEAPRHGGLTPCRRRAGYL